MSAHGFQAPPVHFPPACFCGHTSWTNAFCCSLLASNQGCPAFSLPAFCSHTSCINAVAMSVDVLVRQRRFGEARSLLSTYAGHQLMGSGAKELLRMKVGCEVCVLYHTYSITG
jgi:hypothetical protein